MHPKLSIHTAVYKSFTMNFRGVGGSTEVPESRRIGFGKLLSRGKLINSARRVHIYTCKKKREKERGRTGYREQVFQCKKRKSSHGFFKRYSPRAPAVVQVHYDGGRSMRISNKML